MAWYPRAVRKQVSRFRTPLTPRRVNLHTAVSDASSLHGYFSRSTSPCSHFYVREDGTVEQYVDTSYRAAADLRGNASTISIETWDGWGRSWTSGPPPAWTPAQMTALRDLIDWILATHPTIPRRLATTSRDDSTSWGISWHRLGVPATRLQLLRGVSQTGGMLYSRAVGKVCPGDARIRQIPGLLARTIDAPKSPAPAPTPTPTPAPAPAPAPSYEWPGAALRVDGGRGAITVRAWQRLLAGIGHYSGRIDGQWGPLSIRAEQSWLKKLGFYAGYIDGDEGRMTIRALQRLLAAKGLYRGLIDGVRGSMTVKAEQSYLNSQRRYFGK